MIFDFAPNGAFLVKGINFLITIKYTVHSMGKLLCTQIIILSLIAGSVIAQQYRQNNIIKIGNEKNMKNILHGNNYNVKILELRNYLLKPNTADTFSDYFNKHFVKAMTELGGYTLGQFKMNGVNDRFVWMRGFADMGTRVKFLNDFYINSHVWKEFGPGANNMMINSDNVYLLRPLYNDGNSKELSEGINSNLLKTDKGIIVIDFYICNSTLDKVINLFNSTYIPFLKTLDILNITLWVSEMSENDFPRLPVFQDKNLLLTITTYKDEKEYQIKQEQINSMPIELRNSILELITTLSNLILYPISNK